MTIPVPVASLASSSVIAPIKAQLAGARCSALGITGNGDTPCLALCRALIEHGIPPDTPLHVYRGDVLALRIRTVGEGAQLTAAERGSGPKFERWKPHPSAAVAPPIAPNGDLLPPQLPPENNAPTFERGITPASIEASRHD